MQQNQNLLQLIHAKQNQQFQQIKTRFSENVKYFFNIRRNITIACDKSIIYVIHKEYLKIIDLRKNYNITDLVYNYKKNVVLFFTSQGQLFTFFGSSKILIEIKKDFKKIFMMEWIYSSPQFVHFFIAEEGGIHLYKIQEQKNGVKQVKHLTGRYQCYLYEPLSEFLAGFQYGSCDSIYIFHFDPQKAKNWFKCGEIEVNFDQTMTQRIKSKKRLGLEGNRIGKQLFVLSKQADDYFIDIQTLHNTPYLFFYYSNQGKLQLTPLVELTDKKQITIKLPSDSPPSFNIFDNMLVVHLKNQKITFIYDINPTSFQALVSPYPLTHESHQLNSQIYSSQFISNRVLLPNRQISKWKINLTVIYHYLKNQMQVFQFLSRRTNSKIQTIKWMRQNLFSIKQINLSKMWKSIFIKIASALYDQSQIISMIQIYSNLFYTLSIDPLVNKQTLGDILIECLRQANQFHIIIPNEVQILSTQLLLFAQKYDLLSYLCHSIIKYDQRIFKMIYQRGERDNNDLLLTLSIDLANQYSIPKQVLRVIMRSQRVRQGKRFIKISFQKLDPLDILQSAKYIISLPLKQEFVTYIRSYIVRHAPNINSAILQEAEKKLFE